MGACPAQTSAGKLKSVPPPATELTMPATKAAPKSNAPCPIVMFVLPISEDDKSSAHCPCQARATQTPTLQLYSAPKSDKLTELVVGFRFGATRSQRQAHQLVEHHCPEEIVFKRLQLLLALCALCIAVNA